ncbi:permease [Skermanella mucosa]|uniref:permease n=1 Tax=Skermanella mucosa TaxID=1789672 RepID=UPI00192B1AFC|nr:permease [Skermanella mucosa]UEM19143.1 permease [Skermanella mucosa]
MEPSAIFVQTMQSGFGSLAAYLAAHVLLCLVPAFFIAGGLSALMPKSVITRFLGPGAPKAIAYPAATAAGSLLAVCSCTIVPLFAGIYRKGAGLGPAITFLFFAPAANILALTYTGAALGAEFAAARLVLSLVFGIGIGMIMALVFSGDDRAHAGEADGAFAGGERFQPPAVVLMLLLVALLVAGTLKVGLLLDSFASVTLPIHGMDEVEATLHRLVPFDPARGEEGIGAQGAVLVLLLGIIAAVAPLGLGRVDEGFNRWTWATLALVVLTLAVAAVGVQPRAGGVTLHLTGRLVGVVAIMAAIVWVACRHIDPFEVRQWLWESWRFVRQIFPLLVVGVFAVGVLRVFIRPEWVETMAGSNTIPANLVGVVFGVFMYFPTLVEVPVAQMFLSLGMHPGPLLAYLMADPELSLQSILITASIIGRTKAWAYVGLVALFSTAAGLTFGAWRDGTSLWLLGGGFVVFLLVLAAVLHAFHRRAGTMTKAA